MKVYLDIDNTLIHHDKFNSKPANHLKPFLETMIKNHDVYWLTTHCNGDASTAVDYIVRFVSVDLLELIKRIKPTSWHIIKSEAIDVKSDFLWFDDILSYSDEKFLTYANKLNSFFQVNLKENPDILSEFIY